MYNKADLLRYSSGKLNIKTKLSIKYLILDHLGLKQM